MPRASSSSSSSSHIRSGSSTRYCGCRMSSNSRRRSDHGQWQPEYKAKALAMPGRSKKPFPRARHTRTSAPRPLDPRRNRRARPTRCATTSARSSSTTARPRAGTTPPSAESTRRRAPARAAAGCTYPTKTCGPRPPRRCCRARRTCSSTRSSAARWGPRRPDRRSPAIVSAP